MTSEENVVHTEGLRRSADDEEEEDEDDDPVQEGSRINPYFRIIMKKPRNFSKRGRGKVTKKTVNASTRKSQKVGSRTSSSSSSYVLKKDGVFDPFGQLDEAHRRENSRSDSTLGTGPITSHHEILGGSISLTAEEVPAVTKPLVIRVKINDAMPLEEYETLGGDAEGPADPMTDDERVTSQIEIDVDEIQSTSKSFVEYEKKIDRFRCLLCSLVFSAVDEIEMHLKLVHPSAITDETNRAKQMGDFNCPNCDRTFTSEASREKHNLRMHLRNKIVSCPECAETCSSFKTLEKHLRSEHDRNTTVQCPICSLEFILETSLKHHKSVFHYRKPAKLLARTTANIIHKKKLFKCPKCQKEFETQKALRFHNTRDHKGESYDCNLCNLKIATPSVLQKHLAEVHKVGNLNLYVCVDCKASFQLPQNLEEHYVNAHGKESNFLCYFCGDKFACVEMLRSHKRSHKAFSCKFCSLGFKKEENLEDHLRNVHERDFGTETRRLIRIEEDFEDAHNPQPQVEITPPSANEKETFSKVLEINCDGSVCVREEAVEDKKRDVLFNYPGLDLENLFNGVKLKDLPKKMFCPVCSKVLTTKFLRTHLRSHSGSLPHKCQVCDKAYAQGTLLRKHMKNRHYDEFLKLGNKYPKKKIIECEYCDEKFQDILPLETHLWEHMDEKHYRCEKCAMKFGMKRNLVEHYKNHYFKEEKECTVCRKTFKSVGYYREHVDKCLSKWLCERCGIHCNTQEGYAKHQKLIHSNNGKMYKCETCDKQFTSKYSHRDHMITHTDESTFACSFCPKSFRRPRPLHSHMSREHARTGFMCNYCSLVFVSQVDLQIHKKEHRKETPCEHCGSIYLSRQTLDNHVAVHHASSSDNDYVCSFCSEMFDKQIQLKTHLSSHYTGPIELCQVNHCHKVFKKESLLRSHMTRIHSDLEYFCHFCYRKFLLDSDLRKHLSTHIENCVLKCLRCRFSTTDKSELQEHVSNHSEEPQFECTLCGVKLQHKSAMMKHVRTTHRMTPTTSAADFIVMSSWICSFCDKVFMSYVATTKHLRQHASHGIRAEGTLQKTRLAEPPPTPSLWDSILLKVQVRAEQNDETIQMECWQCPSCFLITDGDNFKKHLLSSSKCQENLLQTDPASLVPLQEEVEPPPVLMDSDALDVEDTEISDFLNQLMTDEDAAGVFLKMDNGQLIVSDICSSNPSLAKIIEYPESLAD